MILNRELLHMVLEVCAAAYPEGVNPSELADACGVAEARPFIANVLYLAEHGLVVCKLTRYLSDPSSLGVCTITAKGLDFLADDGGLTAILGTVVVKLHADTIRDMLLAKAEAMALTAPEKSALRKQIENLPAAALQAATSRLAQEGLSHVSDLVHWMRSITGI